MSTRGTLILVVGTVLLCLPRFAHNTPDSIFYLDLVAYFRDSLPREALHTPFAYRWLLPWLAAAMPGLSAGTALALLNTVATVAAYLILATTYARLLETQRQLRWATALLVLSFPTLNYGPAVLTDAAAFLILAIATHALSRQRPLLLGLTLLVGTGIRESVLLMLPALWLYGYRQPTPHWKKTAMLLSTGALLAALAGRWYFADLPAYYWTPSWSRFSDNLGRPMSWLTTALTLGPLLCLLGWSGHYRAPAVPSALGALIAATALGSLAFMGVACTAAHMSGRFCWPLYLALVPLIAWRMAPLPTAPRAG